MFISENELQDYLSFIKKELSFLEFRELINLSSKKVIKKIEQNSNLKCFLVDIDFTNNTLKKEGQLLDRRTIRPLLNNLAYGKIPNTLSEDGDELDVFIIFSSLLNLNDLNGHNVYAIPIFTIPTIDNQERDDKVIMLSITDLPWFILNDFNIQLDINFIFSYLKEGGINKTLEILSTMNYYDTIKLIRKSIVK